VNCSNASWIAIRLKRGFPTLVVVDAAVARKNPVGVIGFSINNHLFCRGSMEVDMFPLSALTMPNAGLFHGRRRRLAVDNLLRQSNISDDTNISNDANVWTDHRGLDGCIAPTRQVEVIVMEVQSVYQITERLGLKSREGRIANLFVCFPISRSDCHQ
jgi:hypothetical protein